MSAQPSGDSILEGPDVTHARQIERRLGLLVPGLLALFVLSALHARPHPSVTGRGLVVTIAAVGFVCAAVAALRWARRSRPLDLVLAAVLVASAVVLIFVQPTGPGAVALFTLVVFRVRTLPGPIAVAVSAVTLALLVIASAVAGHSTPVVLAALGGFYGMSFLAIRLEAANAQGKRLVAELERRRAAETRAAAMAERQRLAREMHDVLAHSLSGLLLQLDAARLLSNDDRVDPRLVQGIQRAHHLGRSGLDEARRAIATLRGDELPGPERLPALTAQFERDHAIRCRLSVNGAEHDLPAEARLAIYRVAQEGLTNITKHSQAERVEMRLDYQPAGTRLTIEDFHSANGHPAPKDPASVPGGYGLSGMRERAELIGGTLTAAPTSTGFRVELEVPQ
ncbi:MAG: sensor histidine kinase [Solirubrobacteraceae bacterium]